MTLKMISLVLGAGLLGAATPGHAAVEYVKVCSLYGAAFHYIPGTDICQNDRTGDTRQQTVGGTWRSLTPYPTGKWVTAAWQECAPGRTIELGPFTSTDFTLNAWDRKQTQAVRVDVRPGEFVSKVIMSGGFYDPRLPERHGAPGTDGLCVRSTDPNVMETFPGGPENPLWGNGMLPIGCVANSRIINMPAGYAVAATSAYPSIDAFFVDAAHTVSGPYTYGSRLVVTTDVGPGGANELMYFDDATQVMKPMAGKLSVSVCMDQGISPNGTGGR